MLRAWVAGHSLEMVNCLTAISRTADVVISRDGSSTGVEDVDKLQVFLTSRSLENHPISGKLEELLFSVLEVLLVFNQQSLSEELINHMFAVKTSKSKSESSVSLSPSGGVSSLFHR